MTTSRSASQERANFARTTAGFKKAEGNPNQNRSTVFLACPGSFSRQCYYQQRMWSCENCKQSLKYADDGYFYCACGKAPVDSYKFKCSDPRHGERFDDFDDIVKSLKRMRSVKEVNILVLGETGVGKSTWVNAFANYVSHASFEEAEKNEIVYAIPCYHDWRVEKKRIKMFIGKKEEKEQVSSETVKSVTQTTASYVFKYRDLAIRLIDTPGIGDTEGIDADRANLQNILDHLSLYDHLSGICILLPPNQTRLTTQFKFCVTELLRQLHRDACKNIVFVFTRSSRGDCSAGGTEGVLDKLISELQMPLNLTEETSYYINDAAVLYLYALKKGLVTEPQHPKRNQQIECWGDAVAEVSRMIEHVIYLKAHNLRETVSLNETRRVIRTLCKGPLLNAISTTKKNLNILSAEAEKLQHRRVSKTDGTERSDDFNAKKSLMLVEQKFVPLKNPRVICKSANCSLAGTQLGGSGSTSAKQICCDDCRTTNIQLCTKINKTTGNCDVCGCHYREHEWEVIAVDQVFKPMAAVKPTQSTLRRDDSFEAKLDQLKSTIAVGQSEKEKMAEIAAKLSLFLTRNSIILQNDTAVEYREKCELADVKTKSARRHGMHEDQLISRNMRLFCESVDVGDDIPETPEEVNKLIEGMYDLKVNGPAIRDAMELSNASTSMAACQGDKVFMLDLVKSDHANSLQSVIKLQAKNLVGNRHSCYCRMSSSD